MQSLRMLTVVMHTKTENKNEQIGSAIFQVGLIAIIIAAIITPILCTMSPNTWIKAALTFTFYLSYATSTLLIKSCLVT
jgi:hypothetical protein